MSVKLPILYVDDEESILHLFQKILGKDHDVVVFSKPNDALKFLQKNPVKMIFSDERMPELSGHEFLEICKEKYPEVPRILVTGYTDYGGLVEAVNKGKIFHFIAKPWDNNTLRVIAKNAEDYYESRKTILSQVDSLQEKIKELSQLEEAKELFLQLVSHELKTPLTSLLGFWELIEHDYKNAKEVKTEFRESLDRLHEITKHTLLLVTLESGKKMKTNKAVLFDTFEVGIPDVISEGFFDHFQNRYIKSFKKEGKSLVLKFKDKMNKSAFEFIGNAFYHHKDLGIDGLIFQAITKRAGIGIEIDDKTWILSK